MRSGRRITRWSCTNNKRQGAGLGVLVITRLIIKLLVLTLKKKIEKDNKKFEEKMINNKLKVYRAVPQAWP